MTDKEATQFNQMRTALIEIHKHYRTSSQMGKYAKSIGLDREEAIEYAYDNIQDTAKRAVAGIKAAIAKAEGKR